MNVSRKWAALSAVALFLCSVAGAAPEKPIAIVHGRLITGLGEAPIEDGMVVVAGRTIEYAGPSGDRRIPKDARIIDASGKSVMPGLADMHVHLQGGWDGVSEDLLGYQRYLNSLLYSGVTTIMDTGNYPPWVLQLRQEQAAGRLTAARIYCTGAMIDAADPMWPDLAYPVASVAQIPDIVARERRARVDLIKAYRNLSDRFLGRLTEEARRQGLRVIIDQWERNGSPD